MASLYFLFFNCFQQLPQTAERDSKTVGASLNEACIGSLLICGSKYLGKIIHSLNNLNKRSNRNRFEIGPNQFGRTKVYQRAENGFRLQININISRHFAVKWFFERRTLSIRSKRVAAESEMVDSASSLETLSSILHQKTLGSRRRYWPDFRRTSA